MPGPGRRSPVPDPSGRAAGGRAGRRRRRRPGGAPCSRSRSSGWTARSWSRSTLRAWVHNACSVYIALPSAWRQSTGRSGAATAAPVAIGRPMPMAPPVRVSQSCAGAPAVAPADEETRRVALVHHDGALGQGGSDGGRQRLRRDGTHGRAGREAGAGTAAVSGSADGLGQGLQGARSILSGSSQRVHRAARPGRGRWPCRGRRRTTRGTWRRPGRGDARRRVGPAPSRPGRPTARPAGFRPPARGWRGTSHRGAPRRSPPPPGWRRAGRRPEEALPPRSSAARSPERSALATSSTVSGGTTAARPRGRGELGPVSIPTTTKSAGSTSVATQPGRSLAAATASAASPPTSSARAVDRYHPETAPAIDAMSDCSGAWSRAW